MLKAIQFMIFSLFLQYMMASDFDIIELLKKVEVIKTQVSVSSEIVEELEQSSSVSESTISEIENIQAIKKILKNNARENNGTTKHDWLFLDDLAMVGTFKITDVKAALNIKFATSKSKRLFISSEMIEANFNKFGKFGFLTKDSGWFERTTFSGMYEENLNKLGPCDSKIEDDFRKTHGLRHYTNCTKIKFFPIEKKVQFYFEVGSSTKIIPLKIEKFAIRNIEHVLQLDDYIHI